MLTLSFFVSQKRNHRVYRIIMCEDNILNYVDMMMAIIFVIVFTFDLMMIDRCVACKCRSAHDDGVLTSNELFDYCMKCYTYEFSLKKKLV